MRSLIKEKEEVAKQTLMVTFDLLGEEVDFKAGQYFWLTLPDVGYDDERGLRRHITVVTSPNERGVLGFATRMRDTAFKKTLAELEVGAEVDVEHPKGDFSLPMGTERPYVFIAGGIGITVFRCMLRYIVEEGLPHRVTLVYSNRDRESTAFLDELQAMERDNGNISLVLVMTDEPDWEGEKRRVDAGVLRDHLAGELGDYVYIAAGPPGMVEAMETELKGAGVPDEQVIAQRFAGY